MFYIICAASFLSCLDVAKDVCTNANLSDKYKNQNYHFESMSRMNEEGTKYAIYCAKPGAITYLEGDEE